MDKLQMALNHALSERAVAYQRQSLLTGGIDSKRPRAWSEYGYKDDLFFEDYYKLYERQGIAHGALMQLVDKCWQDCAWIIEGDEYDDKRPETAWEKDVKKLFKSRKLWKAIRKADEMRMVGHYAGVILQVADNKRWEQELGKVSASQLRRAIPAWEGQLTVSQWNTDEQSEDYGQPAMWQYQETAVQQNKDTGLAGRSVQIHPSRIIIIGDIREGVPLFRACYNDFVNLEKILGGSGESFLKNSSRQLHINFDKEVDLVSIAQAHGIPASELQELYDEVTRGMNTGIDQTLITKGASATAITADVPMPSEHFDVSLQSASAALRIPSTIIVGKQTGERASTEDAAVFDARCQSRRINELSDDVENAIRHMMRHGMIRPIDDFTVMWSDLTEWGQQEKLEAAFKMADVNRLMMPSGDVVFTPEEIRDTAGFDNDTVDNEPEGYEDIDEEDIE